MIDRLELEASKKQVNESTAEYQTRIERQKQDINSKKEEVNQLESLVNERNHRLVLVRMRSYM